MDTGVIYESEIIFSKEQVKQFAEVTGDKNPIHVDEVYAAKTIFGKNIVHGTLIEATFSKSLMQNFPGSSVIVINRNVTFLRPVFVGETYVLNCKINSFDEASNTILLTNTILDTKGKFCVRAKCTLKNETNILAKEVLKR